MTDTVENNDATNQPTEDDKEWGNSIDDLLSSKGLEDSNNDKGGQDANKSDDANKGADQGTDAATGTGSDGDAAKTGDDAAKNDDDKTGDDAGKTDETDQAPEYDPSAANARKTQREIDEDRKTYISDIREKLYPDLKTELTDSEGKPIRNVSDLTRLENPKTGKAFTEEEASYFLIQAQKHLAEETQKAEDRVSEVADVLITVRDEALAVRHKWGDLLKEMDKVQPGFSQGLLNQYKKTLQTDPETGIIVKNPVSAEEWYDTTLAGYEAARKALQTGEEQQQQSKQEVTKTKVQLDKVRNKQDRGDLTSSNNTDTRDQDDKEWDTAIEAQFGDRINNKKK